MGGGPEMLVEDGKIMNKQEEIVECMSRTCEKITKVTFSHISLNDIEAKIERITKKPSRLACIIHILYFNP